ncbi:hypothetical protein [Massilia genomosp. 1]|uniref:hypothetical protein n=1 Tax=Massilia genomosp. 1 TaxID=2609280 RepID=UPI00141F4D90|nr:hypothetical protein [Massilia genomosp. 1]
MSEGKMTGAGLVFGSLRTQLAPVAGRMARAPLATDRVRTDLPEAAKKSAGVK